MIQDSTEEKHILLLIFISCTLAFGICSSRLLLFSHIDRLLVSWRDHAKLSLRLTWKLWQFSITYVFYEIFVYNMHLIWKLYRSLSRTRSEEDETDISEGPTTNVSLRIIRSTSTLEYNASSSSPLTEQH